MSAILIKDTLVSLPLVQGYRSSATMNKGDTTYLLHVTLDLPPPHDYLDFDASTQCELDEWTGTLDEAIRAQRRL